jgi:hypothetical protein
MASQKLRKKEVTLCARNKMVNATCIVETNTLGKRNLLEKVLGLECQDLAGASKQRIVKNVRFEI